MKQVTTFISTYTADVSAVCSALYEMGGMVVIHDPSGCNSTYNTHDEPRWYEQDSLIFISGLSEIDAIMGNDEKFIQDIVTAAETFCPKFIVILQTPVPYMIGTDFTMITEAVMEATGIDTYYIPTTGMHSYLWGISKAQKLIAETMVEDVDIGEKKGLTKGESLKINLLGVTPLDFSVNSTLDSILQSFKKRKVEVVSCFSMASSNMDQKALVERIALAASADVNLVLTSAGYEAALVLEEKYQIPYMVLMPTEENMDEILEQLFWMKESKENIILKSDQKGDAGIVMIGEAVILQSLARDLAKESGILPTILCPQETEKILLGQNVMQCFSEEEIRRTVEKCHTVIADPMFRPICAEGVHFISLPQESCSGRIYRKEIPDLHSLQLSSFLLY